LEQDNLLIERVLAGETDAFEQIVTRYQKRVYSLCYRMTGNEQDAYDLSQEAFLRVYNNLKSFKGDSSLSTWIYRISSNICIDHLRRSKKARIISLTPAYEEESSEIDLPDDTYSPEVNYSKQELAEAIGSAINRLSSDHRQIIILRDINQLSYDEIGRVLDLEPGTVKSRIFRARDNLRRILTAEHRNLFSAFPSNSVKGGEPNA
jgi:RNA polymerase sigma factor (sigma-70 family)